MTIMPSNDTIDSRCAFTSIADAQTFVKKRPGMRDVEAMGLNDGFSIYCCSIVVKVYASWKDMR